ncbi:hypothetical protein HPB48_003655 [Haemaphysalis longicornis]|uniref:Uncharacterized protein n=1 Tax=Haemaphysalis longicornis TaxID=44386 RepID=A0A9J6FHM5_HAELO|nr:hypothetical protein HPB48_003655 [Haemaphysalis longicornis]
MLWSGFAILLSGDIETNPGPTVEELLESILAKQTTIEKRLGDIEEKLALISDHSAKLVSLEGTVRNLENVIQRQQDRLTAMEDRARRNNLIVFGITESADETREVIEQKVLSCIF